MKSAAGPDSSLERCFKSSSHKEMQDCEIVSHLRKIIYVLNMKIKHLIKKIWKIHKSQMKREKYPSIILPPTHQSDCGKQRGGKRSLFLPALFLHKVLGK